MVEQAQKIDDNPQDNQKLGIKKVIYNLPIDHDGTIGFLRGMVPNQESQKKPLLLIHDIGHNQDKYLTLLTKLSDYGFPSYSYDIRGHGKSGGALGHCESIDQLVQDLLQVVSWLRFKHQRQRPSVIADGAAAILILAFITEHPGSIDSGILYLPRMKFRQPWLMRLLTGFLAEVSGQSRISRRLLPSGLINNQAALPGLSAKFVDQALQFSNTYLQNSHQQKTCLHALVPENYEKTKKSDYPRPANTIFHHLNCNGKLQGQLFQIQDLEIKQLLKIIDVTTEKRLSSE